jgi:hypothetical protein
MLPVLRRFIHIFGELAARYGQSQLAAYTDTIQEAQAILRKVDDSQEEQGRETTRPARANTQNVMDFPQRRATEASARKGLARKLA